MPKQISVTSPDGNTRVYQFFDDSAAPNGNVGLNAILGNQDAVAFDVNDVTPGGTQQRGSLCLPSGIFVSGPNDI